MSPYGNLCADINYGDGNTLYMHACHGGTNQLFYFDVSTSMETDMAHKAEEHVAPAPNSTTEQAAAAAPSWEMPVDPQREEALAAKEGTEPYAGQVAFSRGFRQGWNQAMKQKQAGKEGTKALSLESKAASTNAYTGECLKQFAKCNPEGKAALGLESCKKVLGPRSSEILAKCLADEELTA